MARKMVGVGSVGTGAWILLLLGRDSQDPLFLQAKEGQESFAHDWQVPTHQRMTSPTTAGRGTAVDTVAVDLSPNLTHFRGPERFTLASQRRKARLLKVWAARLSPERSRQPRLPRGRSPPSFR